MDDVQHLMRHAHEESYLFMSDSSLRDRDVFPTPSQYEIRFASPFRNVFSIDLIDATVPRTEYNVEEGRNTLTYALAQPATTDVSALATRTAVVPPGDYTLPQLVQALNEQFDVVAAANSDAYALGVEPESVPSGQSNKLRFVCAAGFTLLMARSGMRDVLGFGTPVLQGDGAAGVDRTYAAAPGWTTTRVDAADVFLSVPTPVETETALEGPVPVEDAEAVLDARAVYQYFLADASGHTQSVTLAVKRVGTASTARTLSVTIATAAGVVVAQGVASFATGVQPGGREVWTAAALTSTAALVRGAEYSLQIRAAGAATSPTDHLAVFRAKSNVLLPGGGRSGDVRVSVSGASPVPIAQTDEDLCASVDVGAARHHLVSPGLANLTGEAYVTVRCPEIEQHMYRDRAFEKYHAGLGMVKLATYGYTDQRFDFVSFPPRKFHAIGKLSKLTIRLEKRDGTLYNARGVDHTLLLVLRYYALPDKAPAQQPVLNPQYTPELHRYLPDQRWAEEEVDDYYRPWR